MNFRFLFIVVIVFVAITIFLNGCFAQEKPSVEEIQDNLQQNNSSITLFGRSRRQALEIAALFVSIGSLVFSAGSYGGYMSKAQEWADNSPSKAQFDELLNNLRNYSAIAPTKVQIDQILKKLDEMEKVMRNNHINIADALQNYEIHKWTRKINQIKPHFNDFFNNANDSEHIRFYADECSRLEPRNMLTNLIELQLRPQLGEKRLSALITEWERSSTRLDQYIDENIRRGQAYHLSALNAGIYSVGCFHVQNYSASFIALKTKKIAEDINAFVASLMRSIKEDNSDYFMFKNAESGASLTTALDDKIVMRSSNWTDNKQLWQIEREHVKRNFYRFDIVSNRLRVEGYPAILKNKESGKLISVNRGDGFELCELQQIHTTDQTQWTWCFVKVDRDKFLIESSDISINRFLQSPYHRPDGICVRAFSYMLAVGYGGGRQTEPNSGIWWWQVFTKNRDGHEIKLESPPNEWCING